MYRFARLCALAASRAPSSSVPFHMWNIASVNYKPFRNTVYLKVPVLRNKFIYLLINHIFNNI